MSANIFTFPSAVNSALKRTDLVLVLLNVVGATNVVYDEPFFVLTPSLPIFVISKYTSKKSVLLLSNSLLPSGYVLLV